MSPQCCSCALNLLLSPDNVICTYLVWSNVKDHGMIIGHLGCNGITSSGQDILRESFSFDDLLISASCEVLLLNPASNSFPNVDPFLPVDGSEVELWNCLFLLRCLALPESWFFSRFGALWRNPTLLWYDKTAEEAYDIWYEIRDECFQGLLWNLFFAHPRDLLHSQLLHPFLYVQEVSEDEDQECIRTTQSLYLFAIQF